MLTVVVLRGPIETPDGRRVRERDGERLRRLVDGFGSAVRWIDCVVTPGANVSVPAAAV